MPAMQKEATTVCNLSEGLGDRVQMNMWIVWLSYSKILRGQSDSGSKGHNLQFFLKMFFKF